MRFTPLVRDLPSLLASGAIGEVRMATIQLGFSNAVNPQRDLFNPDAGGGALLDLGIYPLSLASLLFGTPIRIESQAVVGKSGVDEQVGILLTYSGERQALVTASLRCQTANDAAIMGTHGYLHVQSPLYSPSMLTLTRTPPNAAVGAAPLSHPRLRQVYAHVNRYIPLRRPGQRRKIVRPLEGIGYVYEAAEVVRCLRAGEQESPVLSLDETVGILEVVDRVRQRWAVTALPEQKL